MAGKQLRVFLNGCGRVGRIFARLARERRSEISRRYGLDICLAGIGVRSGSVIDLDADCPLPEDVAAMRPFHAGLVGTAALLAAEADVLVEATPTDLKTGGPGLANLRGALLNGVHVVTLTKGPLVVAFGELRATARERGVQLKYSGATAAALPTADVATYSLAGTTITGFTGVLNGTTNFILGRMAEGADYGAALREAQTRGIAEANPALDVEGWDTAVKSLILANAVMDADLNLSDVAVRGITGVTAADIAAAAAAGARLRLVGRAERRGDGHVAIAVAPEALPLSDPLASLCGTNKGITFMTDTMGAVTVLGGGSDPQAAAAAALKDVINIGRGR
ncbi:MAG: homoserine dehydrogenase [Chloroflexota bacterium]